MNPNTPGTKQLMSVGPPACCSSPSAMCYWCTVSLVAWGVLSLIAIYSHPFHASSATTILLAAAVSCFANWRKNRSLHCSITGPLFLLAALVLLLADFKLIRVQPGLVWSFLILGTGIAFLLEWRYAKRSAQPSREDS